MSAYTIFCDASGEKNGCGASCGYSMSEEEAISSWNSRAEDARMANLRSRLEKATATLAEILAEDEGKHRTSRSKQ